MSVGSLAASGKPRVLVASIRELSPGAAWCSNYEFEDVIRSVDDVEVLNLSRDRWFEERQRLVRSLAWRGVWGFDRANPGVRKVQLTRDYDLFVFVCMNVWDLFYLNAISGWRERCRTRICFMVEFWSGQMAHGPFDRLLARAAEFDHVTLCFSGSVPAVARATGKPCHHVPLAADTVRFTPFPSPPERVIDVLSMGRRAEPVHQELRRLAAEGQFFYLHDTIPGSLVRPSHPPEHRDVLAHSAKRSRFFVAYPAKYGVEDERLGQSEVGARYYEGLAAGAILLGQAPTSPAFRADFPWDDAVIEARGDGSDVRRILGELRADPARLEAMSRRNATEALRRHDWGHRWQEILRLAGITPRPALTDRLRGLADLASATTSAGTSPVVATSTKGS